MKRLQANRSVQQGLVHKYSFHTIKEIISQKTEFSYLEPILEGRKYPYFYWIEL